MKRQGWLGLGVFFAIATMVHAEETAEDEWDKQVREEGKAAEADFATWKSTGQIPEDFEDHVVRGDRKDLIQRVFSGDKLAETEIKPDAAVTSCEVTVRDTVPMESAIKEGDSHDTVWRRITKDRFEIWTPKSGKLYDATGKKIAEANVRRGDGWGRQWYGAFLPDGRWITTDINERDDEVTAFSSKGKVAWVVKGGKLIPKSKDPDAYESLPLIAWARSDQSGKAWIVSVGSEFGRGFVKLTPDGKWTKIENPWKECFPQQLRSRGMYVDRYTKSDDGKLKINRTEAGHGINVGWPHYHFNDADVMIPNGDDFGILPDSWAAFVETDCGTHNATKEERKDERVWFFDPKGTYQHWIKGRNLGASLPSGGLWIRQLDDTCALVGKDDAVKSRLKFSTQQKQALIPVELHDDIGLGLFLLDEKLVLGTWQGK